MPERVLGRHADHAATLGWDGRQDGNGICQTVRVIGDYSRTRKKEKGKVRR